MPKRDPAAAVAAPAQTTAAPTPWEHTLEVLLDAATLQQRVAERGRELTRAYAEVPAGNLVVVAVLKGSFPFFADLVRHIDLPLTCEFIGISSYGDATKSSGVVKITFDLQHSIAGKDVLVVEDIVDSGLSMRYLLDNFATRRPRSLRVCTLLEKPAGKKVHVPIDYTGFRIPDAFVVGYGLDYLGRLRNLPFVGQVQPGRLDALTQLVRAEPPSTAAPAKKEVADETP